MVVIRRFLLTGLGSPTVTAVAVALTGNAAAQRCHPRL